MSCGTIRESDKVLELQKRLNDSVSMNETFKEQVFELEKEVRTLKDSKSFLWKDFNNLQEQCELLIVAWSDMDALKDKVRHYLQVAFLSKNAPKSV